MQSLYLKFCQPGIEFPSGSVVPCCLFKLVGVSGRDSPSVAQAGAGCITPGFRGQ